MYKHLAGSAGRRTLALGWAAAALACGLAGCSQAVHDLGAAAGGGAASGAFQELRKPDTQQVVVEVAGSDGGQRAAQAVGVGLGRGLVYEGTAVATGQASIADVTGRAVALDPSAPAASQPGLPADADARVRTFVDQHVDPLVGDVVRSAVRQGVDEAAAPQSQGQIRSVAETVGSGATHGVATALTQGDLDPAIANLVRTAVRQGMQEALGPQSRQDAAAMAETVGDAATHGIVTAFQRDGGPVIDRATGQRLGPAIDSVLYDHVRPALSNFFHDDIAPTVVEILKESAENALKVAVKADVQNAVIQNSVNLSKGATFGSHDAAIDLGLLRRDGSLTLKTRAFFWSVAVLIVLAGLVAVGFLVVLSMLAVSIRRGRLGPRAATPTA